MKEQSYNVCLPHLPINILDSRSVYRQSYNEALPHVATRSQDSRSLHRHSYTAWPPIRSQQAPQPTSHHTHHEFVRKHDAQFAKPPSSLKMRKYNSCSYHSLEQCDAMHSPQLKTNSKHQPIPNRNNNTESNNTRRDTPRQKVLNSKIPLSSTLIFHHNRSYDTLAPKS